MPVIKRYPNRKLYDTEAKKYVNLDDLAKMIRRGDEVHVVDYASGEDMTALILTQIVFDQEKKESGFLPRSVLAGLIQSGGNRLSSIQRTLISNLGLGRFVDEEIERRLERLVSDGKLKPEERLRLNELLLEQGAQWRDERAVDQSLVERVLDERGIPSRGELQKLIDQLDALTETLDSIHPEDKPS